jgi:hypothetical protein
VAQLRNAPDVAAAREAIRSWAPANAAALVARLRREDPRSLLGRRRPLQGRKRRKASENPPQRSRLDGNQPAPEAVRIHHRQEAPSAPPPAPADVPEAADGARLQRRRQLAEMEAAMTQHGLPVHLIQDCVGLIVEHPAHAGAMHALIMAAAAHGADTCRTVAADVHRRLRALSAGGGTASATHYVAQASHRPARPNEHDANVPAAPPAAAATPAPPAAPAPTLAPSAALTMAPLQRLAMLAEIRGVLEAVGAGQGALSRARRLFATDTAAAGELYDCVMEAWAGGTGDRGAVKALAEGLMRE